MIPFELHQKQTIEEIERNGQTELYRAFEKTYRKWLNEKVEQWPDVAERLRGKIGDQTLLEITRLNIPEIAESNNFNIHRGALERACAAAKHLAYRYDIGTGIAKKGLWTSFIFNLYGLKTRDCLIIRADNNRLAVPLDFAYSKDYARSNVILFDNDALTGKTIQEAKRHVSKTNPKSIDALLIFETTELSEEELEIAAPNMKYPPKIIKKENGILYMDTTGEVQPYVRKLITLEQNYKPRPELLSGLAKKLGVHYEPKA
jgi:hypothetical protein